MTHLELISVYSKLIMKFEGGVSSLAPKGSAQEFRGKVLIARKPSRGKWMPAYKVPKQELSVCSHAQTVSMELHSVAGTALSSQEAPQE